MTGNPVQPLPVSRLVRRAAHAALALAAVSALCGCSDDDDPPSVSVASVTPGADPASGLPAGALPAPANQAPTIAGAPPTSVTAGSGYAFTPEATDPDGDALTFGIKGQPAWAAFEPSTGALSGTPTQNDVGTSGPIEISATDGVASAALAAFTIDVVGTAPGSVPLTWIPPTQNEDGSPLTDLAGYKLYWGTEEGSYPNSVTITNPGITSYVVEQLTPATWHFVMTAVTADGLESEHSNLATAAL